jgi:predicted SAM-dependent methyltransferase
MKLLNAGCGTHYAEGWLNVDVWTNETIAPDQIVTANEPYPFENDYFDAVFLGHVIEHMPWDYVPVYLDDMRRITKPGGKILIVGPDVYRTLHRWKDGKEPWHMVLATLEHQDRNLETSKNAEWWDGASHHWNCHHQRVWDLLQTMGFKDVQDYFDVIPNNTEGKTWHDESTGITWPVVGKWFWQFAIHLTAK